MVGDGGFVGGGLVAAAVYQVFNLFADALGAAVRAVHRDAGAQRDAGMAGERSRQGLLLPDSLCGVISRARAGAGAIRPGGGLPFLLLVRRGVHLDRRQWRGTIPRSVRGLVEVEVSVDARAGGIF